MKIHNIKNEQQNKNLREVLPSKYHHWEFLNFSFDYKLKKKKKNSEHQYKNYVNSWCFNNKNVFTAAEQYRELGGPGKKPQIGQFKVF